MNWLTNLYHKFLSRSVVERIILLNVAIFILAYLFNTFSFLFQIDGNFIVNWFSLQPEHARKRNQKTHEHFLRNLVTCPA